MTMPYAYLWEFRVRPERRTEFEGRYGPTGSWVALFRRAPGYLETLLLQDRADEVRYITIDRWQSVEAYRAFRARFAEDYEALDRECEGLTTHEAPLGEFNGEQS
jgi:heme-degrading monooxygenase HmoA